MLRFVKNSARNTGATSVLRSTKKLTTPEARTKLSPPLIPRLKLWLSQPTKSLQSLEIPWHSSKYELKTITDLVRLDRSGFFLYLLQRLIQIGRKELFLSLLQQNHRS